MYLACCDFLGSPGWHESRTSAAQAQARSTIMYIHLPERILFCHSEIGNLSRTRFPPCFDQSGFGVDYSIRGRFVRIQMCNRGYIWGLSSRLRSIDWHLPDVAVAAGRRTHRPAFVSLSH